LSAAAATPAAGASDVLEYGKTGAASRGDAVPGLRATPAARRTARERRISLDRVRGSEPNGRIQNRDLVESVVTARRIMNVNREWLRRGEGPPIVFLHGFGADLHGWRPVQRLLPETWPALAVDLPGHGLSPLGEEASFGALVAAVRAALAEEGAGVVHLIGHSLGGAVAVALAHEAGVKALSLMLIASARLGEETNAAFFDGFLQADTETGLTSWLNMLVTDPASLGSAMAAERYASRRAAACRGATAPCEVAIRERPADGRCPGSVGYAGNGDQDGGWS
jgi:pyruvate dehydrogenase E2 component (dihydrolipoamide acetyltransferase)